MAVGSKGHIFGSIQTWSRVKVVQAIRFPIQSPAAAFCPSASFSYPCGSSLSVTVIVLPLAFPWWAKTWTPTPWGSGVGGLGGQIGAWVGGRTRTNR